jgi:hypothetical protein
MRRLNDFRLSTATPWTDGLTCPFSHGDRSKASKGKGRSSTFKKQGCCRKSLRLIWGVTALQTNGAGGRRAPRPSRPRRAA